MVSIIIENHIPFVKGVLDEVASVRYLAPEDITPEAVRNADALVTRTRTRVDRALLEGSRCRFVATATIGTDHIDTQWCAANGVTVANAPGCNAPAVAQYVMSSLLHLRPGGLEGLTIGVVGAGHVGGIVARWAEGLGMNVMLCDPPRAEAEGAAKFHTMADLAREANVITFHTPLTKSGKWPTYHLCDHAFLASLERHPIIINSARGGVADTVALTEALRAGRLGGAVIDCWENEPDIDRGLLRLADIATPHIAGYSRQGKIRATRMAVDALTRHFGLPAVEWREPVSGCPDTVVKLDVAQSYDPLVDTVRLKGSPDSFERQRTDYELREEVGAALSDK